MHSGLIWEILMVNEIRVYYTIPGKLQLLIARFQNHTLEIWHRFNINHAGFWTTLIGEDNNALYYMLVWQSLADREDKWTRFLSDPEWLSVRKKTEAEGPLVARISSQLLLPTHFPNKN